MAESDEEIGDGEQEEEGRTGTPKTSNRIQRKRERKRNKKNSQDLYPEHVGRSPYSRIPLAPRALLQRYKIQVPTTKPDTRPLHTIVTEWSTYMKGLRPISIIFDGTIELFFTYLQELKERRALDFMWDAATYYLYRDESEDYVDSIDLLEDFTSVKPEDIINNAITLWREDAEESQYAGMTLGRPSAARRIFADIINRSTTPEFRAQIQIPESLLADGMVWWILIVRKVFPSNKIYYESILKRRRQMNE